ncbi:hypothetical protein GHT06_018203 [Daphnia sinensis]|uniref:Uncharacterized protein n=1 Tax=Daphnia sinensis TaxID=1820382 RepID=A0AAD5PS41_9CRUS|nr:hypothetical protein GHT06_018203 [Daphnia sinensis]
MAVDVVRKLSKLLLVNNNQQQKEILQQTIDKLSREDILKAVPDVVHSNGAPNLIRLVLEGLSNSSHHRDNLMLNVMKSIITELCDSEAVPENCAVDIVHLMSLNSHDLSSNNLAELVQLCLSFIQKGKNLRGKWLSLFPMIFSELEKQNRVTLDSDSVTGAEYCDGVISSLCNTEIAVDDAVAFTAVLRELKIPATIVHKFVLKLCAIIPDMEPQEVPPFVYQLLFLCYQSDHLVPLEHLAKYFEMKLSRYGRSANLSSRGESMEIDCDIETGSPKEILQAKATSIFHISRAAATGHPLGKEFVKFLRSRVDVPELVLVPFILEVALSLGALPQLRDIIGLLRKLVQRLLRSSERLRHSAWMRELMLGKQIDVQKMFDTIMQQGTSEGDNIVKGFELLAFDLLEIRNAGGFGRPNTAGPSVGNTSSSSGPTSGTVTEQCWHIGAHILLQMIRKFPDSAPLIVKKLAERLQDVSNDSQYITTICLMVQHNPLSMLECKASFTMLLYSMEYRGLVSAKRLYAGISPLFRSSGALRDSAFLVLRKLLHSCLEEVRQVAVVGFLEILKNFRFYVPTMGSSLSQTSISSQATVDVHHSQSSNSNRAFCSELLKLLQCALSQQASVRLTLYQNLPEVVSRNPELLPECIKMLRCHLKFFIDPEAVVQVDMCITKDGHNSHVIEPLGHLIQAIQQSILRSGKTSYFAKEDIDPKSEDQVDLGILLIRKVVAKMAESSVDDYAVGDVQEPSAQLKIQTLSSVCIALADFCLAENATTNVIAAKRLVSLFEMQTRFDSLLSEAGKGKGKGKAPKRTKKGKENSIDEPSITDDTPKTPMKIFEKCTPSLQSISVFIGFLKDGNQSIARNEEEILAFFKSQIGLRLWFAQSAFSKYQAFCNNKDIEGLSQESVTKFSGTIACALLLHCQNTRQVADDRSSAMYCTALNCLHDIILGFCKHNPAKLGRLLSTMDQVQRPAAGIPLENQIANTLKHFKDLLNRLLSGRENEDLVTKAVLPIVGTLIVLSDQLDPAGAEYAELSNWTHNLCKNVECRESSIAKPLINLLAHLNMASESSPSILEELAKEVRLAIGTLDEENSTTTESNKLATINEDTAAVVLTVLTVRLEQLIQVVEWALPRIGILERGDASPLVEQSINTRLKLIAVALSQLVLADVNPGPNSELILKLAISFYTTMGRVAKKQKSVLPSFRTLVRATALHLTKNLNNFIAHLDDTKIHEKGVKRKKGDKEVAPRMDKCARSIPQLTYAIEQYNQAILGVSKRTKEDLTFGSKLGTTRDFRIKADKVNEALEGNAHSTESELESESESGEDVMEANSSVNRTAQTDSRVRGTARRSRGRGRGKFTSVGKANTTQK